VPSMQGSGLLGTDVEATRRVVDREVLRVYPPLRLGVVVLADDFVGARNELGRAVKAERHLADADRRAGPLGALPRARPRGRVGRKIARKELTGARVAAQQHKNVVVAELAAEHGALRQAGIAGEARLLRGVELDRLLQPVVGLADLEALARGAERVRVE